jgi:hypothetical protein
VSIEDIADAVGHVNSTVTKTTYRHQIVDEVTAAATAMDAIFGDATEVERLGSGTAVIMDSVSA